MRYRAESGFTAEMLVGPQDDKFDVTAIYFITHCLAIGEFEESSTCFLSQCELDVVVLPLVWTDEVGKLRPVRKVGRR